MQTASAFARAAREIIDGLDAETSSSQAGIHRADLTHGATPIVRLTAAVEGTGGADALLVPQLSAAKKVYVFDWDVCIEDDVLVRTEKMEVQPHLFVEMSVSMEEGLFLRAFEMLQQRLRQVNPIGDGIFLYAQIRDKRMRSHIGLYKEAGFACHRHVFPPGGIAHPTSRVYDLVRPLVTVEERLIEADMEQVRDEEAAAERAREEEKAKRARQKQARRARRERLADEAKKAERARQARRERQARKQKEEEEEDEALVPMTGSKRTTHTSVSIAESKKKKQKIRCD